ncbi:DNA-binding protein [Acutalibacter sp. 1XD8-33]|uniref:helix-turn-helix domain-containing protein n=1 Tax=Acutalibacter sp. 1XD8-33 TaxID=2320081 RepID=UPI000EA190D5|nr:helix-turn-helix domain-containing protein [Acutalibacter sp. 1XD8-33]RKJ41957.1 DNA-binding protein [Acutalibacter sp. 1XD8-33]
MKSQETICANLAQALMDCLELLGNGRDEPPPPTRLYTYDDLAQMLGKSKSTVREWVRAGKFGEPVTVGSSTRVTQAGVDKFIADHSGPMKKQPSKARTRTSRTAAARQGQPLGI